jgi:hypothetical protein
LALIQVEQYFYHLIMENIIYIQYKGDIIEYEGKIWDNNDQIRYYIEKSKNYWLKHSLSFCCMQCIQNYINGKKMLS